MEADEFEELGAQYREAKVSIGTHRQRQAQAEVAYAETLKAHHGDRSTSAVMSAKARVDQTVTDVEWCKAVAVAAGEAYKGEPFADVVARNEAHRSGMS